MWFVREMALLKESRSAPASGEGERGWVGEEGGGLLLMDEGIGCTAHNLFSQFALFCVLCLVVGQERQWVR